MAEVVVVADKEAAGQLAAGTILDLIAAKPDAVLGLATGSTPLPVYRALAAGAPRAVWTSRTCAASRSTSTWGCRRSIPSRTGR